MSDQPGAAAYPPPGAPPSSGRPGWLIPAVIAGLVVLVIVLLIVLLTGDDDGDSVTTDTTVPATAQTEPASETTVAATTTATEGADTEDGSPCPEFTEKNDLPIKLCDSGDLVRTSQQGLANWASDVGDAVGDVSIEVDGFFGPETDAAVRAFQTIQSLEVDGIIGANTWALLCPFTDSLCEADGDE